MLLFDGRDLDAASGHGHGGGNRAQYPRNLRSGSVGVDSRHGGACHRLRYLQSHLFLAIFVLHGGKFFLLLFFEFLALAGVLADLFNFAVVPLGDRVFLLLLLGREELRHGGQRRADKSQCRHGHGSVVLPRLFAVFEFGLQTLQLLEDVGKIRGYACGIAQRIFNLLALLLVLPVFLVLAEFVVLLLYLVNVRLLFLFRNDSGGNQFVQQAQFVLLAFVQGFLEILVFHGLGLLQKILAAGQLLAQVLCIRLRGELLCLFGVAELRIVVGTLAQVGEFDFIQAPLILLFRECTLQVFALGGSVGLGLLPRDVLHTPLRLLVAHTLHHIQAFLFEFVPLFAALLVEVALLDDHVLLDGEEFLLVLAAGNESLLVL